MTDPLVIQPESVVVVVVEVEPSAATVVVQSEIVVVEAGIPGPRGLDGTGSGTVSADIANRARRGSDGGVFVPEWVGDDPLFFYLNARGDLP